MQIGHVLHHSSASRSGLTFDGSYLHSRVHALLHPNSRRLLKRWQVAALLGAAGLTVVLAVEPLHHGAEWMIGVLEHNVLGTSVIGQTWSNNGENGQSREFLV